MKNMQIINQTFPMNKKKRNMIKTLRHNSLLYSIENPGMILSGIFSDLLIEICALLPKGGEPMR